jgi:hypothetical protein
LYTPNFPFNSACVGWFPSARIDPSSKLPSACPFHIYSLHINSAGTFPRAYLSVCVPGWLRSPDVLVPPPPCMMHPPVGLLCCLYWLREIGGSGRFHSQQPAIITVALISSPLRLHRRQRSTIVVGLIR